MDEAVNKTFKAEEQEELDTHHDYLHQLVRDLSADAFKEFCNEHCLPINDGVAVSNYITDLDYSEVLGIIKEIEEANDLSIRYMGKNEFVTKDYQANKDQANEDAIEESFTDTSGNDCVPYDDDYDIRCTAIDYKGQLENGHFRTKKECILDYITKEFGSQGARYTDITKFAFYLNHAFNVIFNPTRDRGYYSMGISGRNPYLVYGGKDYLVKGINQDGNERYFALSNVESVTEYWKHIK